MGRAITTLFQTRSARPTGRLMTYAEFLDQFNEGQHVEWINGESSLSAQTPEEANCID